MLKNWLQQINEAGQQAGLPLYQLLVVSLMLHLITLNFSIGTHHFDEHYQILEFANMKMEHSHAADLPWEYSAQIRPTVQPTFCYFLFSGLQAVGITNPFIWKALLQFGTMLLAFFVTVYLSLKMISFLSTRTGKKAFWLLSLFLWFMPYLHQRFTAENIGGILFMLSVLPLFLNRPLLSLPKMETPQDQPLSMQYFLIGMGLGLAFFVRFQLAFAIVGVGLWVLFKQKIYWKNLLLMLIGGILMLLGNIFIDAWFYDQLTFSPYNYFHENIVEDKASNFGVYPWWYYFAHFAVGVIPPISLALLPLFFYGLYRAKQSVWTWAFLLFMLAHFAVGHKELRFFYSFIYLLPFVVALAWEAFLADRKKAVWQKLAKGIFIFNLLILLFMATPVPHKLIDMNEYYMQYLYKEIQENGELIVVSLAEENPFEWGNLEQNFYKHKNCTHLTIQSLENISQTPVTENILLYKEGAEDPILPAPFLAKRVYQVLPDWIARKNYFNYKKDIPVKVLYKIERRE